MDILLGGFCLVFAMPLYGSVYMCLVVTCLERADLLALVCGVLLRVCYFPIGNLGQVWYLIYRIPDLCTFTYFNKLRLVYIEWLRVRFYSKPLKSTSCYGLTHSV